MHLNLLTYKKENMRDFIAIKNKKHLRNYIRSLLLKGHLGLDGNYNKKLIETLIVLSWTIGLEKEDLFSIIYEEENKLFAYISLTPFEIWKEINNLDNIIVDLI